MQNLFDSQGKEIETKTHASVIVLCKGVSFIKNEPCLPEFSSQTRDYSQGMFQCLDRHRQHKSFGLPRARQWNIRALLPACNRTFDTYLASQRRSLIGDCIGTWSAVGFRFAYFYCALSRRKSDEPLIVLINFFQGTNVRQIFSPFCKWLYTLFLAYKFPKLVGISYARGIK